MNRRDKVILGLMLCGVALSLLVLIADIQGIGLKIAICLEGLLLGFGFLHLVFGKTDS